MKMKVVKLFFFIFLLGLILIISPKCTRYASDEESNISVDSLPKFPWPPREYSASYEINDDLLRQSSSEILRLGEVNDKLINSLEETGYIEKSFLCVPHGFALVTHLEQINSDGSPKTSGRWSTEVMPLKKFSLDAYLKALFTANPGLYRILVFVVTPNSFSQSKDEVGIKEAMEWLSSGLNKLPNSIANLEYTKEYRTTVLIYEFIQPEDQKPYLIQPGKLTGKIHLEKSGLLKLLQEKL